MTYTAPSPDAFLKKGGSLTKKLTSELSLIDAELDALAAVDAGDIKVVKGSLTAGAANAFAFAWQNPESSKIHVNQVVVDITTAGGTATAVIDVGVASSATGTADTILDGIDANADAIYSSLSAGVSGSNATGNVHRVDENAGTNDYVTGKILVEAASSLVGKYYIYYTVV